jgi:ApbE superfamily uncharacterized protein (UPF0280 family)
LASMVAGRRLDRAYVNNGGDIAVHLSGHADFRVGMVPSANRPELAGRFTMTKDLPVRGVASSGRDGRSFSLGIADAVTALAADAASADVAATLIANSVNIDDPAIQRRPAIELDPNSDLGTMGVTVSVGELDELSRDRALDAGLARAKAMCTAGLIYGAVLVLDGEFRVAGTPKLVAEMTCAEASAALQ